MSPTDARRAFTLIELLLVIAIVGILAAVATPTYLNMRADALNDEATRIVRAAISNARVEAKRSGAPVAVTFVDGATSVDGVRSMALPNGGVVDTDAGSVTLTFVPPFGAQADFAPESLRIVTGNGSFRRTAVLTVVPPLGKTGVVR